MQGVPGGHPGHSVPKYMWSDALAHCHQRTPASFSRVMAVYQTALPAAHDRPLCTVLGFVYTWSRSEVAPVTTGPALSILPKVTQLVRQPLILVGAVGLQSPYSSSLPCMPHGTVIWPQISEA